MVAKSSRVVGKYLDFQRRPAVQEELSSFNGNTFVYFNSIKINAERGSVGNADKAHAQYH